MKEWSVKTIDNVMKGIIKEEGIIGKQAIRYEEGKRPKECTRNYLNYLKESLNYRDEFIPLYFIYDLEQIVAPFNLNLKKI